MYSLLQAKFIMLSPQPVGFSRPSRIANDRLDLRQKEWSGSQEENIPWELMILRIWMISA